MDDSTVERDGSFWCRVCGGYAGLNPFDEHDIVDCAIDLRTRLDELESEMDALTASLTGGVEEAEGER